MSAKPLTTDERLLLQRHFDDEADVDPDAVAALLEARAEARIYVAALKELRIATRMADEAAWDARPDMFTGEQIVQLAETSEALAEASLEDLAPLLERYFDDEIDAVEAVFVAALLEEREDAAAYLAELAGLRSGVRHAGEMLATEVDFSNFWGGIEAKLDEDADASPAHAAPAAPFPVAFDPDEHTVLLYRFHDNEVSASERALVEGWIDAGEEQVVATLAALAELHVAVNAGTEMAQERVDLHQIWAGVELALEEQPFEQPAAAVAPAAAETNVVSLASAREKSAAKPGSPSRTWRAVFSAAAAVALVMFGALLADRFMHGETVIIQEKTVVIVDSVEYAPGASVMINSPVEQANHPTEGDQAPTVIWLLDDEEDAEAAPNESPGPI